MFGVGSFTSAMLRGIETIALIRCSSSSDILVWYGAGCSMETERDVTMSKRREPRTIGDMETMGPDSEIVQ